MSAASFRGSRGGEARAAGPAGGFLGRETTPRHWTTPSLPPFYRLFARLQTLVRHIHLISYTRHPAETLRALQTAETASTVDSPRLQLSLEARLRISKRSYCSTAPFDPLAVLASPLARLQPTHPTAPTFSPRSIYRSCPLPSFRLPFSRPRLSSPQIPHKNAQHADQPSPSSLSLANRQMDVLRRALQLPLPTLRHIHPHARAVVSCGGGDERLQGVEAEE